MFSSAAQELAAVSGGQVQVVNDPGASRGWR